MTQSVMTVCRLQHSAGGTLLKKNMGSKHGMSNKGFMGEVNVGTMCVRARRHLYCGESSMTLTADLSPEILLSLHAQINIFVCFMYN